MLSPATSSLLAERIGHDIVTSDGTTLLGADDKAGVAEIMAAAAYLIAHPALERARARIAFTVDEEVGRGTDHLDLGAFDADLAYTLDGSVVGEIENETFSAVELKMTFHGVGVHPGTAKGRLVNPVKLAAQFVASLPRETLSPETTEGREGFVHPFEIEGGAEAVTVTLIVRDHDATLLAEHEALVRRLADEVVASDPRARVSFSRWEQYRNMREALDRVPRRRRRGARGDEARRARAEARVDPRRHRRRPPDRARPADPERVRGRERLPLAAGVDQRRRSGDLRRHDRRAAEGLGRAGPQALARARRGGRRARGGCGSFGGR